MRRIRDFTRRNAGSISFTIVAVAVTAVGLWLARCFWWWLHPDPEYVPDVSNSDTLRTVGLLIGGAIAFLFGIWRAWIAERQATASQGQADAAIAQVEIVQAQLETAQVQAETAQQSLLNERFQRGAEMLGNRGMAERLRGIDALQRLAGEHAEEYHIQIMRLLCAFVRNPTPTDDPWQADDPRQLDIARLREDVESAMNVIGQRDQFALEIERQNDFFLDLSGAGLSYLRLEHGNLNSANLEGASLRGSHIPYCSLIGANLAKAELWEANLPFSSLTECDLSLANLNFANLALSQLNSASFYGADLTDAVLHGADLRRTNFHDANVSATDFSYNGQSPAIGLTQPVLDSARIVGDRPPSLFCVVDLSDAIRHTMSACMGMMISSISQMRRPQNFR